MLLSITTAGVSELATMLRTNISLREIQLTGSVLEDKAMNELLIAMKANRGVQKLDLSCTSMNVHCIIIVPLLMFTARSRTADCRDVTS